MKMLETILLATDFRPDAGDASRMAVALAKTFHSRIILAHVVPDVPDSPLALEQVRDAAQMRLDELRAEITRAGVETTDAIVAVGTPFDQLIHLADYFAVNVIIAGSGDKSAEDEFRLGLTAERLVRKANKPVWLVRPGNEPALRRILCPVDFSETARRALHNAIHLARSFQAQLDVLAVVQPVASMYMDLSVVPAATEEKYFEEQRAQFHNFLKGFDFHGVNWTKSLRQGVPHKEILHAARATEADLLVMGSVGRTGLARILMGSVAEKVIREMPCSVITVKAEDAIRLQVEKEIADTETAFRQGAELLKNGFPQEALREFERCVARDALYAAAWEAMAGAQKRLGRAAEASQCEERARQIRLMLWQQRIEAEVRAQHPLWGNKP